MLMHKIILLNNLFKFIIILLMLNRKMNKIIEEDNNTQCDLKRIIECPFCGRTYDKNNKPYILKCSHNICHKCLKLNVSNLLCIKCKFNCSQRELSRFPLNFLLAEIVEKIEHNLGESKSKTKKKKDKDKDTEIFYCGICNLVVTNKTFHLNSFPEHELIEYQKYIISKTENYNVKEKVLMDKFKETKDNYIQIHKDYYSLVINNTFLRLEEMIKSIENSEFLDNLVVLGLISNKEKINLELFSKTYSKEFISCVLKESRIETIFNIEVKIKNNSGEIKILENEEKTNYINNFFCDVSNLENTLKNLSILEHNLEDIDKKIASLDMKEITKNIFEDIIIQTNHTLNINFKKKDFISFSFYLTENFNLLLFNPITLELETYDLKKVKNFESIYLEGSSIIFDDQKNLFISGGMNNITNNVTNNVYKINLSSLEVTKLLPMDECRFNHHSFIRDNKLYVVSGKVKDKSNSNNIFENTLTCEKYDIFANEWKKLPNFPKSVKELKSFFCDQSYNFGIDNLKRIYYLNDKNKWKECKITFKDPIDVELRNFLIISKDDYLYFIGGIDSRNELSDKIYKFSTEDEEFTQVKVNFSKKIQFKFNNYSNFNNNYYVMDVDVYNKETYQINVYKTNNLKDCQFNFEKQFNFSDLVK